MGAPHRRVEHGEVEQQPGRPLWVAVEHLTHVPQVRIERGLQRVLQQVAHEFIAGVEDAARHPSSGLRLEVEVALIHLRCLAVSRTAEDILSGVVREVLGGPRQA